MANATVMTVTTMTPNTPVLQPVADILDTGTGTVYLSGNLGGRTDRVLLEIKNTAATANLTVNVRATPDNPPALRAGLGKLTMVLAPGEVWMVGPFESARFLRRTGYLDLDFTPASGTISATVRCYKLSHQV